MSLDDLFEKFVIGIMATVLMSVLLILGWLLTAFISEAFAETISIRKDQWQCSKHVDHSGIIIVGGKALPSDTTECIEYSKIK